MSKYKLLKELIDRLEEFEKNENSDDFKQFYSFLQDVLFPRGIKKVKEHYDFTSGQSIEIKDYAEVEFSTLLVGLNRFAKHYTKKALENSSFRTLEEFGLLANLLKEGSLLKSELINSTVLEISSGTEMLKRLIKSDLIKEYPDSEDKRAKRISLTEKGISEILKAFSSMHQVANIISGCLSDEEIQATLAVFKKLSLFHHKIHETDRNTGIDELVSKYLAV
jgi:DNA-binding MarR family transcriptional regulator